MISARPPLTRSSEAKSWCTRTGSAVLGAVTALASRIFAVACATAARVAAGEDTAKSRLWCSPSANTSRPSSSARIP